ncbi:PH domain-containing protein [Microbacterium koreense]
MPAGTSHPDPSASQGGTPRAMTRSPLSDGEWHRMHPFSPLLRGGLALVVVAGIIIANFRDRFIQIFFPALSDYDYGDPLDFVFENNLVLVAGLVVLGVIVLLIVMFWVSWRFHTFRITGDDVEVRSGVLFRTHRRAPLDRVQGVNLTRPMLARLVGLAKLEVVGAGLDSNVKLEYLSTANAETVRADILRLASGAQLSEARADAAARAGTRAGAAAATVSAGITGLIEGAEEPADEPESVVAIPPGRLIGSRLLSGSTVGLVIAIIAIIVGSIVGTPWVLFGMVPALLGFGAYWIRSITRALRYSIAPTSSGVRITFGLFTTVTEILPPGRIHAVQVSQSIFWRPFGWWTISVNRLSGRGMADSSQDQFASVLPVGTRDDVERVLRLLLPSLPSEEWPLVFEHGLLGPSEGDPYTTTPRRARLLRLLTWRRNGFEVTDDALFVRRGVVWRTLGIFPLARMQSISITQGPVDRALRVANLQPHTITGTVSGNLGILDRDDALAAFDEVSRRVIGASASDRTHRWAGGSDFAMPVVSETHQDSGASGEVPDGVIPVSGAVASADAAGPVPDVVSPEARAVGARSDAHIHPNAGASEEVVDASISAADTTDVADSDQGSDRDA